MRGPWRLGTADQYSRRFSASLSGNCWRSQTRRRVRLLIAGRRQLFGRRPVEDVGSGVGDLELDGERRRAVRFVDDETFLRDLERARIPVLSAWRIPARMIEMNRVRRDRAIRLHARADPAAALMTKPQQR